MGPKVFALLALASNASAWELSDQIMSLAHSHHASALREMVHEYVKPHLVPLHTFSPKDADECGACMRSGSKFVLEHAFAKLKDGCAKAAVNNCRFAKVCALMASHPNVTLGMVIEHVRPLSLSTAYCMGKGACHKPNSTTLTEIMTGQEPHEALVDSFDEVDWSAAIEDAEALAEPPQAAQPQEVEEEEAEALMCLESKGMPKVCPKCMKHTMKGVMTRIVMKVKEMCATANSPMLQKMCPWAAQNKEIAFGMLLGKVEPWKIAFGFCINKGHHGHGKPGHGKHGHGKEGHGEHGHGEHGHGEHGHGKHGRGDHGHGKEGRGEHGHGKDGHGHHGSGHRAHSQQGVEFV